MAESIRVEAPDGAYDILIEPGLQRRLSQRVVEFGLERRVMVVSNPTLMGLFGDSIIQQLPKATAALMADGEQHKTLQTVARLYEAFVAAGLDRAGTVIALGGGVVGDTAGFAAATYMRGVRLVQMPTSLLAMVDSSVGGKVGVDLPQGKNLVGAFKQPDLVLIDPDVLRTLPEREWRCGIAEVIKHGLLGDDKLLQPKLLQNVEQAPELIHRAIQVKVNVVQQDPYEQGIRAHLNLGHTFAHAIERVSRYQWVHGEAVGVGLLAAAHLSYALGLSDKSLPGEVEALLRAVGLPRQLGWMDAQALYDAMASDKKWFGGRSRFVLLSDIGQPVIVEDVPAKEVIQVLELLK